MTREADNPMTGCDFDCMVSNHAVWGRFSPSALSLFRFHLSPFPPETPDTQARGDLKKSRGDGRERGRACRQTSVACEQALCLGKKIARKGKFDQRPVHRPQGAHTICLCSRLLFYSKFTGFTVCFTYSDISLTMYINL